MLSKLCPTLSQMGTRSTTLKAILFPLVEQIRFRTAQVHDLRTPVSILLTLGALFTVERVTDPRAAADNASTLVTPVVALVTYLHQVLRPHITVADHALAVAFLAQPANGDSWLFAAHDQIRVVLRHVSGESTFDRR